MAHVNRLVEVFTAGYPVCEKMVDLVRSMICRNCEVRIDDLREGCATDECRADVMRYRITAVPAVAVNGEMLDCCRRAPITADLLRAAGIGQV